MMMMMMMNFLLVAEITEQHEMHAWLRPADNVVLTVTMFQKDTK